MPCVECKQKIGHTEECSHQLDHMRARTVTSRVPVGEFMVLITHRTGAPPEEWKRIAQLVAAAEDLLQVAQIEQELHLGGYTKATAKRFGQEAEEAYLSAGAPGLNDWRRRKRESAIAKAKGH